MKESEQKPPSSTGSGDKPAAAKRGGGAPIGTHSLTGSGTTVGMPATPQEAGIDSRPHDEPPAAADSDPLAEPRQDGDVPGSRRP